MVVNRRLPLASADLSSAVLWDPSQLESGFALVRDTRAIPSSAHPDFPRRPAFLYPDDGCFVRAEFMDYELQQNGYPRPSKVFSFGNLNVETSNTLSGTVSWWYHVAPLVSADGQLYVLDPAIDPSGPMALEDWLTAQDTLDDVEVSLCDPFAYVPNDNCSAAAPLDRRRSAMNLEDSYLDAEWQRQLDLGRDPGQVLGYNPPWSSPSN